MLTWRILQSETLATKQLAANIVIYRLAAYVCAYYAGTIIIITYFDIKMSLHG